jgi:hypothetical protein
MHIYGTFPMFFGRSAPSLGGKILSEDVKKIVPENGTTVPKHIGHVSLILQ